MNAEQFGALTARLLGVLLLILCAAGSGCVASPRNDAAFDFLLEEDPERALQYAHQQREIAAAGGEWSFHVGLPAYAVAGAAIPDALWWEHRGKYSRAQNSALIGGIALAVSIAATWSWRVNLSRESEWEWTVQRVDDHLAKLDRHRAPP